MSNKKLPAFPPNAGWEHSEANGLSKREYFAAMAMQGLATNWSKSNEEIARNAIEIADALLAELER